MTDRDGRRSTPWLVAAAGYGALTLAMFWPIVTRLASAFPHDPHDPALNTWILWWNAHAMPLTARWRDAPIFWPMSGSLALSEHLVGISVLTTPLQWAGLQPVTAYNVAWLASFPLCALAAHALVFTLVTRHDAATLGGLVFGFNPYRVAQSPHLQTLWAFGLPLALYALHRYAAERRPVWLGLFASAWLLQALSNGYYLLFFPVLVAMWLLWFMHGRWRSAGAAIAGVWAGASLVLVPFLWSYVRTLGALNLQRKPIEIDTFSADAIGPLVAAPDLLLWRRLSRFSSPEGELFPGALALVLVMAAVAVAAWRAVRQPEDRAHPAVRRGRGALALVTAICFAIALSPFLIGAWRLAPGGIVLLSVGSAEKPMAVALLLGVILLFTSPLMLHRWRERSVLTFYLLACGLTYLLSLGPRVRFAGVPIVFRAPYSLLLYLPGFTGVRSPARFGMLFVLCVAAAAALAFARATHACTRRAQYALAVAACALVIVESWPALPVAPVPPPIRALERDDATSPVLELPAGGIGQDTAALFRSMRHRRPVVNGYSGYVPPHYQVLGAGLRVNDGAVLSELARGNTLLVAIDRRDELERWTAVVVQAHGELVDDDGEWRVYRVRDESAVSAAATGAVTPLPIAAVTSNTEANDVTRMLDGDLATWWNSGRVQGGGEEITIDLGAEHRVTAVRLTMGEVVVDFPRRLGIDCRGERGEFKPCWSGSAAGLALRAALENPRTAAMTIPIGLEHIRHLRLRQTGADPANGWSIAELAVLGR